MANFVRYLQLEMLLVVLALCVLQGDATYYSRSSKLIWTYQLTDTDTLQYKEVATYLVLYCIMAYI